MRSLSLLQVWEIRKMSDATGIMDELSTLKQEVAELNESRKLAAKVEESKHKKLADPVAEASKAEAGSQEIAEHEIVGQLEKYLKEIEEVARERPALALLTAFAIGVVVGQLFSRK
jgi:ElaB/YqjD/DUF883 family membrane-anchored ribosome-binding protein